MNLIQPVSTKSRRAFLAEMAALMGVSFVACNYEQNKKSSVPLYTPDWESLSRHKPAPDWLVDAKFGIYFTWGVFTVPEKFTEWYPRSMYEIGNPAFEYQRKTYGDQKDFGYHDFVPMFKAEKFDAAAWAAIIKSAGARFAGPCAEHHDGFSMWNSKINPWNAVSKGPHKDITGELSREIKKQGLKFITTFHHDRHLQRNANENNGGGYDSHFIYNKEWHTSSNDPELRLLYGNMDPDEFNEMWFVKIKEVIDQYGPDVIYFDSWLNLLPEQYRKKFCAYYLNHASAAKKDVAIIYKQHDLPATVGVNDIEKGGHMEIFQPVWMTDDTVCYGSWSYADDNAIKPVSMVLHSLIDIVSKNGILLLNVSPRADGSIPPDQQDLLKQMGQWLTVNGEAIYNTRPWLTHGDGPTGVQSGAHGGMTTTNTYTPDDFRFTQSKDGKTVYVILLGKPAAGKKIKLRQLAPHRYPLDSEVLKVVELASGLPVDFEQTDSAAYITFPDIKMNQLAVVVKISLK